ncbi:MAG: rhomboid family intramembrane serine protease [Gemmatimonadaceae bacterium]|nr:rhomboid family intramembrane serine protease [Gemmatimonadaceae bacterium]
MSPTDSSAPLYRPPRHIGPAVAWLLGLNIAVYFLQVTVVSPADMFDALGFHSRDIGAMGRAWWTIGTYMFVHGGFWHLVLNMYTLWLFGPRVEAMWSPGEFTRFYLFAGLGGWFLHLLMAGDSVLIGASAAVIGVMLAYATLWPHEVVYLFGIVPMTVRWLMVLVVMMNLLGGFASTPDHPIAYLAHLGGLGAAWLYLRTSARVNLAGVKRHVEPVPDVPEEDLPHAVPKSHRAPREPVDADDAVARSKALLAQQNAAAQRQPAPTSAGESETVRLNRVLDKISATGLESLTAEERQLLDDASKRRRQD